MKEQEYNWKNLVLTAADSAVKAITIDALGTLVCGLVFNSKDILSKALNSILIGTPTYFLRGVARDFEHQQITKEYLGDHTYILPYVTGIIAGGIKSNWKNEDSILKGALRTLSYEVANDYVNNETLFDTMSTILTIEEGAEVFGEKFLDTPGSYKNNFIASAIYTGIIKYVYVPVSTYTQNFLEHELFPIGLSETNTYAE